MPFNRPAYMRDYMRDYMRKRRAAQRDAAQAAQAARVRANAAAISAHVLAQGGACRVPRDIPAISSALSLADNDWTPAVNLLLSEGRAHWARAAATAEALLIFSE